MQYRLPPPGGHVSVLGTKKKKKAEALKVIKINEFKNCFKLWKKVSIGVLHQMQSTWKVTEV